MAQILVCSVPNPGHVNSMLTIGGRLAALDHKILFHTGELFRNEVEARGLKFVGLSGKANYDYRIFPDRSLLPPGLERLNLIREAVFSDTLPDQYRGLQEILDARAIDLIVIDTLFYGVLPLLMESRSTRPPVICCGINPMLLTGIDAGPSAGPARTPREQQAVATANRNFLKALDPFAVTLTNRLKEISAASFAGLPFNCFYSLPDQFLQFSIPEFEFVPSDMPAKVHLVGPLPPEAGATFGEPSWWHDLDGSRPVVLVTQGTLANANLTDLIVPTLTTLADEDVLVIAATGKSDSGISTVNHNARIVPFVPFDHLLPKVDVFLTNGGYGAVNQALTFGVPIVAAGQTEDKGWVSQRVEWSGVGVNLRTSTPSQVQIRTAVHEVLSNPSYRSSARALSHKIAQSDALGAVETTVRRLLQKGVPEGKA
ncbi:nucleotide disphospho-sugar-binding domain-containing protein [Granulicella sp. dw_53]|uniref:glycosyltransferase n=1 Tax=Granulicella sp. dw_53 TaxID=2719792 RepID=UPI001BD53C75|nr:nucleotide disphospho-sugar-binding domain-containing protein [Granulicella sp. dw_53]